MIVRKIRPHCVLFGAALLVLPPSRAARAQQPESDPALGVENEKALQTFREGIAAFDRRDFEAARVAFLQTFALKPTAAVVRRNLGLAEIYSGHYLEGARRLGRVIHTTDEGSIEDRARMVESLKKAEAHLERVTVEVNVEGAAIQIGGVELGASPLPFAWYLEPGAYDVRVTKPGFVAFTATRLARAGSAQHLRIHLKPIEAAPPVEPPRAVEPQPVADAGRGPNPWVIAAGSVLTAGGLASGLTLSFFAADNADKAERIRASLGGIGCSQPSAACEELRSAARAHDRQQVWSTVSFALGAAAGVSTIVYALLASSGGGASAPPASGASTVGLAIDPSGPRLTLDGSF